jgi:hypothetical protein
LEQGKEDPDNVTLVIKTEANRYIPKAEVTQKETGSKLLIPMISECRNDCKNLLDDIENGAFHRRDSSIESTQRHEDRTDAIIATLTDQISSLRDRAEIAEDALASALSSLDKTRASNDAQISKLVSENAARFQIAEEDHAKAKFEISKLASENALLQDRAQLAEAAHAKAQFEISKLKSENASLVQSSDDSDRIAYLESQLQRFQSSYHYPDDEWKALSPEEKKAIESSRSSKVEDEPRYNVDDVVELPEVNNFSDMKSKISSFITKLSPAKSDPRQSPVNAIFSPRTVAESNIRPPADADEVGPSSPPPIRSSIYDRVLSPLSSSVSTLLSVAQSDTDGEEEEISFESEESQTFTYPTEDKSGCEMSTCQAKDRGGRPDPTEVITTRTNDWDGQQDVTSLRISNPVSKPNIVLDDTASLSIIDASNDLPPDPKISMSSLQSSTGTTVVLTDDLAPDPFIVPSTQPPATAVVLSDELAPD